MAFSKICPTFAASIANKTAFFDLHVEKSAYTDEQLDGYNRYRGIIWHERTLVPESHCEGFEEGKAEGVVEGIEKGREEEKLAIARSLKQMGLDRSGIVKATGLSAEEIAAL